MTSPRHILSTFDVKSASSPVGAEPDELMIDWTTLPTGSTASLYFPAAHADDILATAAGLYGYQPFAKLDAHTVGLRAQGIGYVPIPRAPGNLAGFVDVELPSRTRTGEKITVAVSQLTTQSATIRPDRAPQYVPIGKARGASTWRKVKGTFKLAPRVRSRRDALPILERNLSILRW